MSKRNLVQSENVEELEVLQEMLEVITCYFDQLSIQMLRRRTLEDCETMQDKIHQSFPSQGDVVH